MKLYKFPVLAMIAATALFTSCSDEGDWDAYNEPDQVYTFDQAAPNYNFTPVTIEDSIVVTLTRSNVSEEKVLPITAEFSTEELSGPAEVVFEKGKNQANYIIKVGDLVIGETSTATLAFTDSVSVSGTNVCEVSIKLDYTWQSAGSCQMYSSWAGNESPVRVPIEAAAEAPGMYRFNSPYYYLEKDYCPKEGYHIQFYLDENHNALEADYISYMGETISGYPAVFMYFANGAYDSVFINEGSEFLLNGVVGYVTSSGIGLYTYESLYFLWDKGYPGAQ